MGSGNRQHSGSVIGKQIGKSANIAGFIENTFSDNQQGFTRFGHTKQAFTTADKYFDTQFIFKLANMAAYPRLRGIKDIRDLRQVVILTCRFTDDFKLLEIHSTLRIHQTLRYC
ncbi:hypothetical protein D3C81_1664540 [compost metagenome]